ncbi:hypothetical protein BB560_000034 [Smittium megazygosporum]|uniref:Uncharacterized protein n=1 Tax=Smittium megazygosporum TaxID=133381 RepID=A0A2T9ZLF7_9FUNG|nr:hypothetical protein BB560_000034 [Smittium megazygosporum]
MSAINTFSLDNKSANTDTKKLRVLVIVILYSLLKYEIDQLGTGPRTGLKDSTIEFNNSKLELETELGPSFGEFDPNEKKLVLCYGKGKQTNSNLNEIFKRLLEELETQFSEIEYLSKRMFSTF